jgi:hypothetical protein
MARRALLVCASAFVACVAFAATSWTSPVWAQGVAKSNEKGEPKKLVVQQTVEPSFRVEPIVHRFKGRRGEVIPFQFTLNSTTRPLDLELTPIELRQEESGVILFDGENPPSSAAKLLSPGKFVLEPGKPEIVKGEVTVPSVKTNFVSFGLLVRDRGLAPDFVPTKEGEKAATQAGIRFITQYVLRCDIEVESSIDGEVQKLKLEDGALRSVNGMPVATVFLSNPTDSAFEFQLRGSLDGEDETARKSKPFWFNLPARAAMPEPDKYLVRVLPRSRLRLEAPASLTGSTGKLNMSVAVAGARRDSIAATFDVTPKPGQFPALDASMARLEPQLSVSPPNLLLTQGKGGKQLVTLVFANATSEPRKIMLSSKDFAGEGLKHLRLPENAIVIPPHRSQSVRVSLKSDREAKGARYGYVNVTTENNQGEVASHELPVAIFFGQPENPLLEMGELEAVIEGEQISYQAAVKNVGTGFAPIHAELRVTDEGGRRAQAAAGFGRWLAPGESFVLTFNPEMPPTQGDCEAALQWQSFENVAPESRKKVFRFAASSAN